MPKSAKNTRFSPFHFPFSIIFCTFAPNLKNRIYILLLFSALALCARAETIVLHTGARVKGTIVFQNEEVVIVRDASGARFQYPKTDVQEILADDPAEVAVKEEEEDNIGTTKKVSIQLQLSCGAAVQPSEKTGATYDVDLLVGSHHIGDKHIFVGLGVGYHGLALMAKPDPTDVYHFLPITAALRLPLIEQQHAPTFGFAVGYGVALNKDKKYVGGAHADLDFGYRYQINEKTALELTAFAQFQQAKLNVVETVEGVEFINRTGRIFAGTGLRFSVFF